MIQKGIIQHFEVEKTANNVVKVTLTVHLDTANKMVEVQTQGTVKELCSRFEVIPFKDKFIAHPSFRQACVVYESGGQYSLVTREKSFSS